MHANYCFKNYTEWESFQECFEKNDIDVMKKVAILFRGHCYTKKIFSNKHITYDTYHNAIKKQLETIVNGLSDKCVVDVFVSTYKNHHHLFDILKPKRYISLNANEESQRSCISKGLDLIDDVYDFIIVTRFDVLFKRSITLNISKYMDKEIITINKFRSLIMESKTPNGNHKVNDIFFCFPSALLNEFRYALQCEYVDHTLHDIVDNIDCRLIYLDNEMKESDTWKEPNKTYTLISRDDCENDYRRCFVNYKNNVKIQIINNITGEIRISKENYDDLL